MCQTTEILIKEEKIKLAKEAIKKEIQVEEISDILDLPVAFVQDLARSHQADN